MNWGNPHGFWYLGVILLVLAAVVLLRKRRLTRMQQLLAPEVWKPLIPGWKRKRGTQRLILWGASLLIMTLTLARPQWGFTWEEVTRRGLDMMIVLDTSRSMLAPDLKPNRLQQAKWAIEDMLERLDGDRVGLVPFAGTSYMLCPLTVDYPAFVMTLQDVDSGLIPRGGTAIEDALRTAMRSFGEKTGQADRVIVLITDGDDHEGNPLALIDALKEKGIRVYTVGVGTVEGELIPTPDNPGGTTSGFLRDKDGQVIKTSLNETLLTQLAIETGGSYLRATAGDFGLDRLLDRELARLQRDTSESKMAKRFQDKAGWFLGAALLLLLAEAGLREHREEKP